MGKIKVSAMPAATTLTGSEIAMVLQNAQNKKATLTQFRNFIGAGEVLFHEKVLTSAEILNMHVTPVTILSSPGVGFYTIIHNAEYTLFFGTTAYIAVGSPSLQLYYGTPSAGTSLNMTTSNTLIAGTFDRTSYIQIVSPLTNMALSTLEDKAITMNNSISGTSFWTTGDGTFRVRLVYSIASTT